MSRHLSRGLRNLAVVATLATVLLSPRLTAAVSKDAIPVPAPAKVPTHMTDDALAIWLAMRCVESPEAGRPVLVAALDRMGWSVKDREGNLLRAPAIAEPTGLAMRDYEIEALFWNVDQQPGLRLITYARALAVMMPTADPEDIAQSLLNSIRAGAESAEPRRRFWARFIIALGMAQNGVDLAGPGDPQMLPPDTQALKGLMPNVPDEIPEIPEDASDAEKFQLGMAIAAQMMNRKGGDVAALVEASTQKPVWPHEDPVLGRPIPPLKPPSTAAPSPEERMDALQQELNAAMEKFASPDPAVSGPAQKRYAELAGEMSNLNEALQVSSHLQMLRANDPDFELPDENDEGEARFMAQHRATPLSALQIALLTRVVVADLMGKPPKGENAGGRADAPVIVIASLLPLPRWIFAQAAPGGPPTSFSGQVASAGADIWATASGTYTSLILDLHLPENPFSERVGQANAIMGWFKTLMMLFQTEITIDVKNEPLIRTTKRDRDGEPRTVKCVVNVEFPKTPDAAKALRGLLNIASIDLQMPDGGPQSGAKVVWRLTGGGENTRYSTNGGGSQMRPDLAFVQFRKLAAGEYGNSSRVSYTNDAGEAFIEIEGRRQKKTLPSNVRPKTRHAEISVDVTMKVGNLMQDLNDAVGAAGVKGAPGVLGVATMISEMIQRSSLFFGNSKPFKVTDWVEPSWEGRIEIKLRAGGNKNEPGQKGGPDAVMNWGMNRTMIAYLQTPEWDQEEAAERGIDSSNRIRLEVTEATTPYTINDFSSSQAGSVITAFTAKGPVDKPRPAQGGGPTWQSKAEPSGYAILTIWPETDPPRFFFEVEPSFYVKAHIFHFVSNRRSKDTVNEVRSFSLLEGIHPASFTANGTFDPSSGKISGHVPDTAKGSLPDVPEFDVFFDFEYNLHYQAEPPNAAP